MSIGNDASISQNASIPEVGSVPHALTLEGATRVYVEVHAGMHKNGLMSVGVLALHDTVPKGEVKVAFEENIYRSHLLGSGIVVSALDRAYDPSEGIVPYTSQDLERVDAFLSSKRVGTALDPLSLRALLQLDPATLPPILLNMYRTADNTPDDVLKMIRTALRKGVITGFTVDSDTALTSFRKEGFSEGEVQVIYNGTDLNTFKYSEERRIATRKKLAVPDDAPLLMTVSRWDPVHDEKDVPLFLQSAAKFLRDNPEAHVAMVGPGLTLDNEGFYALVNGEFDQNPDLLSRLHPVGLVDIQNYYPAADVVVGTPREDSRPLYIGEAFASGVPVAVSTDAGDAKSMIGENGAITTRNPEEIAAVWKDVYERRHELAFPADNISMLGQDVMIARYAKVIGGLAG